MEADQTPNIFPSAAKSDEPSERVPREAEHPPTSHCHSPAQIQQSTSGHTQSMATNDSIAVNHSGPEEAANCVPLSSSMGPSRREQDPRSGRDKQNTIQELMSAHQPLGPTSGPTYAITPMAGGQIPAVAPRGSQLKRTFLMVIHLVGDNHAQRVSCLDTGSDVDVISMHVVNSLGLTKEKYHGSSLNTILGTYDPQWQVTFDWHIAKFQRTYTNTFVVFDEANSEDFDILLGRFTIHERQFWKKNPNVWFHKSNDEEMTPSLGVDDAKHIVPSVKVDKRVGE
ncbi:hypothetical protein XPA_009347 [Xanthoria parietina]